MASRAGSPMVPMVAASAATAKVTGSVAQPAAVAAARARAQPSRAGSVMSRRRRRSTRIGQHPAEEGEDQGRDQPDEAEYPQFERRMVQLVDLIGECNRLHPPPEARDALAEDEEAIVAMPPGGEGSARGMLSLDSGHARRPQGVVRGNESRALALALCGCVRSRAGKVFSPLPRGRGDGGTTPSSCSAREL
ncbi:MAG: hypothetical protein V9E83_05425 [Baekduia sp.]